MYGRHGAKPPDAGRDYGAPLHRAVFAPCLSVICICAAFFLALVPCNAHFDPADFEVSVAKSEAHAVAPVAGAYEFLELAASTAGLSTTELVSTIAGMGTISTGMVLGNKAGVKLGNDVGQNLSNLIDAADYPDFDTLSTTEQEAWGTRQNYESAKFNSFMNAFGMGDAAERYYDGYGSGGGDFTFTESEIGILGHIGEIGTTWINKGNVAFGDIASLVNREQLREIIGTQYATLINSGDGYPETFPSGLRVGVGNGLYFDDGSWKGYYLTTEIVYFLCWNTNDSGQNLITYTFSEGLYNYNSIQGRGVQQPTTYPNTAPVNQVDDFTFYSQRISWGGSGWYQQYCNMPLNVITTSPTTADANQLMAIFLRGEKDFNYETLVDYPEDGISDDQMIQYPEDGVQQGDNVNNYYYNETVRPENPYNPGDQTGKDPWKQETKENVLPLLDIKFDKLFPFSLLYDVPKMVTKVQELTVTEGGGDYSEIRIPVEAGEISEEVVLDLDPLHQLLIMVRPFTLILLIVGLLMALVAFWRSILTG